MKRQLLDQDEISTIYSAKVICQVKVSWGANGFLNFSSCKLIHEHIVSWRINGRRHVARVRVDFVDSVSRVDQDQLNEHSVNWAFLQFFTTTV